MKPIYKYSIIFVLFIIIIICLIFFTKNSLKNISDNKYIDELNLAIENNNISKIDKYLSVKRNINIISNSKLCNDETYIEVSCISPLDTAAVVGNYNIVKKLIDNGADVNFSNPLFMAVGSDNLDEIYKIVELLLSKGADPNKYSSVPVISNLISNPKAFISKDEESKKIIYKTFKLLIDNGATIEFNTDIEPLIITATRYNNYYIVEYLIKEKKVDVNIKDNMGKTALDYAKNNSKVKKLLESS